MTRDYKHAASRKKKGNALVTGWVWGLFGFVIGVIATFAYHHVASPPNTQRAATTQKPIEKPKTETARKPEQAPTSKPKSPVRFEFYTLLPESEVVIPEDEFNAASSAPTGSVSSATRGEEADAKYILQAGSFKKQNEAESFKAELALLGIVAHVQTVDINADTWYRVRIGPITSKREINRLRNILQNNQVNTILVKQKS